MSNKLIYLMCFVVVLGLAGNVTAQIDPATVTTGHVYLFEDVVDNVPDDSANDNAGNIVGDPVIVDGLYGKAMQFDGIDDGVHIPDSEFINVTGGPFPNRTVIAIFNCTNVDKQQKQVVFEEGGLTRGLTIYVFAGKVYVGGWNKAEYQWNPGSWLSAPVASGNWHAAALVIREGTEAQEEDKFEMWLDGNLIGKAVGGHIHNHANDNSIGYAKENVVFHDGDFGGDGAYFEGAVDEVWILNAALTDVELGGFVGTVWPFAYGPSPSNGSQHESTSVDLSWVPGGYAVSHDVYFGANMDDVAAGLGDTFKGNQAETTLAVAGLDPETTYYWRIDEVNDAHPDSPWIGDVWSFTVPPAIAYNPSPADGAKFVGPAVTLSWTAGVGAMEHTVYIGDDFTAVSNATGGVPQTETTYDAGVLAKGTMYHWRVDESDGTTTLKGDVWSFETPPNIPITDPNLVGWWKMDNEGFGVAVVDSSGYDHHGTLRGDPQWVPGYAGGALDFDGTGDYVNIDGYKGILSTNDIQHPFSVTAWVNNTGTGNRTIVSWGTSTSRVRVDFRLFQGRLRVEHGAGNRQSDTPLNDGEWHHVALTMMEGATVSHPDVKLWLDGVDDTRPGTDPDVFRITPRDDMSIGRRAHNNSRHFVGMMDDVRLYDKELNADEIKQVMRIDPALAWDPQPANGTDSPIWMALSWQAGDGAAEHDVYLGTDAAAVAAAEASDTTGIYLGRQAETMVVPDGLAWLTTYYWRVDEVASDGTITSGLVWKFTTTDEIVLYDIVTPFPYDISADPFLSEISLDLDPAQDWTGGCVGGIGAFALSYDGLAAPGSVTEADGVYTVVGRGADIWGTSDQFQYAHTTLTGDGSMTVKVESLAATHNWTKAGIMIRESLDPGSAFAAVYATGNNGVRFQGRVTANMDADSDTPVATDEQKALTPPLWLKIERTFPMINAYYSTDGVAWTPMAWNPQVIPMTPLPIQIGLAVTSHSGQSTYAEAVFSNLSSTGGVAAGPLTSTEIGLQSNSAEPMYLALTDASGAMAAVLNPDPAATQLIGAEWIIDLDEFNIDRTAVAKATLVIGDPSNPAPGGSGTLTINKVSLRPDVYVYDGDAAAYTPDGVGSLDGTWSHDNGSDQWDGSGIGDGNPGGAAALTEDDVTFLRIQDTGDPRDYGMGDPGSNRKVYLTRAIENGLDGARLEFRIRVATSAPLDDMHPDGGGGIAPWPAEGIGYHIRDNGKGMLGIGEAGLGVISFSLAQPGEPGFEDVTTGVLVMNNLVGAEPSGDVDTGDTVEMNTVAVGDVTQWNTFVIDIAAGGAGTHIVSVSVNGGAAQSFEVTAGTGLEGDGNYMTVGSSGTGGITAFDVDTVSYMCK